MPGCAWEGQCATRTDVCCRCQLPQTPRPRACRARGCCKARPRRASPPRTTEECTFEPAHHPVPRHGAARGGAAWWRADRYPCIVRRNGNGWGSPSACTPRRGGVFLWLVAHPDAERGFYSGGGATDHTGPREPDPVNVCRNGKGCCSSRRPRWIWLRLGTARRAGIGWHTTQDVTSDE